MPRLISALVALLLLPSAAEAARPAPPPPTPPAITFAGESWTVRDTGKAKSGPGPNVFSSGNVGIDAAGRLHLRITKSKGVWSSAEVTSQRSFGRGTYSWSVYSVTNLDPNATLGLFTWNDDSAYNHREIDVELARWGNAADPTNAQFAVQPYDGGANLQRFTAPGPGTYGFRWGTTDVSFFGDGSLGWTYANAAGVPLPGGEHAHMNLWLFNGRAPTNGQAVEVVLDGFTFTP